MNQTPSLSFIDAIKAVFKNFANFNGRARRSEFWWWYLFTCIVNSIFAFPIQALMAKKSALVAQYQGEYINAALNGGDTAALEAQINAADPTNTIIALCVVFGIVSLILLIPTLAVGCRRLHDVGKSGKLQWLVLLCGVGYLIPLIMCIPDGNPAPNQYGPSPKYADPQAFNAPQAPQTI